MILYVDYKQLVEIDNSYIDNVGVYHYAPTFYFNKEGGVSKIDLSTCKCISK